MEMLDEQVELLTMLLVDTGPEMQFGLTIRALLRRHYRGHADSAVAPPGVGRPTPKSTLCMRRGVVREYCTLPVQSPLHC